jgi:hypothetical protein
VTGGLILSLLLTSVASASLFLVLTESRGPAGTVVRGHTGGNHAFAQQVPPLPTSFVDQATAESVVSPDDVRLIRVGELVVDAAGNGTITFVVPSLPPGPYALMVYCPSCAQYSVPPGQMMARVADFTITPDPPNTAIARREVSLATIVGAILLAGALSMLRLRMRSS